MAYKARAKIEIERYSVWTQTYHPLFVLRTCAKCIFANLKSRVPSGLFGTRETVQIVGNGKIYFTILIYFFHHIVALRCVAERACAKQTACDPRV